MKTKATSGGTDIGNAWGGNLITALQAKWAELTGPTGIVTKLAKLFGGSLPEEGPLVGSWLGGRSLALAWADSFVGAVPAARRESWEPSPR